MTPEARRTKKSSRLGRRYFLQTAAVGTAGWLTGAPSFSSTAWAWPAVSDEIVGSKRALPHRYNHLSFPRNAEHPFYYTREQIEGARERVQRTEWGRKFRETLTGPSPLATVYEKDRYYPWWYCSSKLGFAAVMTLPEEELLGRISEKVGFYLSRCPKCHGNYIDNYWSWNEKDPTHFRCNICNTVLPNPEYPANEVLNVMSPTGKSFEYRYYEDKEGVRYFFDARQRNFLLDSVTHSFLPLAHLYALSEDRRYARRLALILNRLAEVYPEWPMHGPGKGYGVPGPRGYEEQFFPADPPFNYVSGRYSNWYLSDLVMAGEAAVAYDLIYHSGELERLSHEVGRDVRVGIERDFLSQAAEVILEVSLHDRGNPCGGNANGLALVGCCLNDRDLVSASIELYREIIENYFNYDGIWHEASSDYHDMVVGAMLDLPDVLMSHSDAAGYPPAKGVSANHLNLYREYPCLRLFYRSARQVFSPNGYNSAANDSWPLEDPTETTPYEERAFVNYGGAYVAPTASGYSVFRRPEQTFAPPTEATVPQEYASALLPDTGFIFLRAGSGDDRSQVFLDFGRFSTHQHLDALQIALFAKGFDLTPDVGYTYTQVQPFTRATASHNTVIVDGLGQDPSYGRLLAFLASPVTDGLRNPMQFAEADATPVYHWRGVSQYARAAALVPVSPQDAYVFDVFRVKGGKWHDWVLHGSADYPQQLEANVDFRPLEGSLLATMKENGVTPSVEGVYTPDHETRRELDPKIRNEIGIHEHFSSGYDFIKKLEVAAADGPLDLSFHFKEPLELPLWAYAYSPSPPVHPAFAIPQAKGVRLNTLVLGSPGTQLLRGIAPGVRRAAERDDWLDKADMTVAVVRRRAGASASQFVAIHQPYSMKPFVDKVDQIAIDSEHGMVAVRVDHTGGTDFIICSADPESDFRVETSTGKFLEFSGRFGLLRVVDGKIEQAVLIEGKKLSWGTLQISNDRTRYVGTIEALHDGHWHSLCSLDTHAQWPSGNVLAGHVVLVENTDHSTSPYVIDRVERRPSGSRVHLRDVYTLTLGRSRVAQVSEQSITSDIPHPKSHFDSWYRGKRLLVGGTAFTIRAVREDREFVVQETDRLAAIKPGEEMRIVNSEAGLSFSVPAYVYVQKHAGVPVVVSNSSPAVKLE